MGKKSTQSNGKSSANAGAKSGDSKLKTANFVKARHILCSKQSTILEVHKELVERTESQHPAPAAVFAELAAKFSECPSGKRGGDLGWFDRQKMEPKFRDVAFSTTPGSFSEPFKGAYGWRIVLVEGRRS
ncbi:Peptidyl-prolyl cis-trans isomerase pin4 [Cyanidiococcus yangmingshanensis]|uniref:Peptidyl-prolyl cis-trans isomerase n=1 Tax=Cyanidiococcus yangmingshanensis TaxID=2690220 RepID=A0A7J7IDT3_9RHOD|nr:Peptidyl-prolyl cis-trans isomerase pin4 [Cyanidiococcus yangmingshanensis]